jgi:hypothetical protein
MISFINKNFGGLLKYITLLVISFIFFSCSDDTDVASSLPVSAPVKRTVIDSTTIETSHILFTWQNQCIGSIESRYIPEIGNITSLKGPYRFEEPIMMDGHYYRLADLHDGEQVRNEIDSLKKEIAEMKTLLRRMRGYPQYNNKD